MVSVRIGQMPRNMMAYLFLEPFSPPGFTERRSAIAADRGCLVHAPDPEARNWINLYAETDNPIDDHTRSSNDATNTADSPQSRRYGAPLCPPMPSKGAYLAHAGAGVSCRVNQRARLTPIPAMRMVKKVRTFRSYSRRYIGCVILVLRSLIEVGPGCNGVSGCRINLRSEPFDSGVSADLLFLRATI